MESGRLPGTNNRLGVLILGRKVSYDKEVDWTGMGHAEKLNPPSLKMAGEHTHYVVTVQPTAAPLLEGAVKFRDFGERDVIQLRT